MKLITNIHSNLMLVNETISSLGRFETMSFIKTLKNQHNKSVFPNGYLLGDYKYSKSKISCQQELMLMLKLFRI